MILGYDTETTGLPYFKEPSDDPKQPHVVQLAMILQDMEGNEVDRFSSLVKPGPGAVMASEALEAHGITLEQAMDEGIEALEALERFLDWSSRAGLMVGHNESFDRRIMRIMSARHKGVKWEPTCPNFCTMWKSKFILRLPATEKMRAAGMPGPKSPNLGECIKGFFGETLEGAHDAMVDISATMRVFWHLVNECGVPMFKPASPASTAPARRSVSAPPRSSASPFAAAASLLGGEA